jgi:ADP-ribosylglycohydrolase
MEYTYYDPSVQYKAGVFDETCQGTVPVALLIIQNSNSFEDAIREAMRWGGDSDTLGAIVGAMAEALYGVPEELWAEAEKYLPTEMREMVDEFYKTYVI